MTYALALMQLLFVPLLSPLAVGVIRKIKAKLQNRQGASVIQPYRNLRKLFQKDEVVSEDASWIFMAAPYVVFAATLLIAVSVPIAFPAGFAPAGDMLVFIYAVALGAFFMALGGIDVGGAFGGTGASREMTLAALAEGGLLFTLLVPAMMIGSTNLHDIAAAVGSLVPAAYIPLVLAFVGFFIVLLSENARYPFDNPATHLELTMVHEAMLLEYSGKRLALMEWAAANKLFVFLLLGANVFFPPGIAVVGTYAALAAAAGIALAKAFILAAFIAIIESSIPKLRYFRLPELLFTAFALGVVALMIVMVA